MRFWTRRLIVLGVLFGFLVALGATPAGAAPTPAPVANPSTVAPGQAFTVSGVADCITGTTLTVAVPGLALSTTTPGDADWQVNFTAPTSATPGTYPITISNSECSYPDGSVTVALAQSISLVKTVGTTPGVCATTSTITVASGTTVYYCYTVTNNTNSALTSHSLTDDKLGTLLSKVPFNLAVGANVNTVTLGKTISTVATATTTNTGTWTSYTDPGVPFTATASATVTVSAPTTTTTAPVAAPAVAAATTPQFTG